MTGVEDRLAEWAEHGGIDPVSLTGSVNILHRVMREGVSGATAGSGGRRGGGPTPRLALEFGAALERFARVSAVQAEIARMPEVLRQVIRCEWVEGMGYRRAMAELGWTERQWQRNRSLMIGWLAGRLGVEEVG